MIDRTKLVLTFRYTYPFLRSPEPKCQYVCLLPALVSNITDPIWTNFASSLYFGSQLVIYAQEMILKNFLKSAFTLENTQLSSYFSLTKNRTLSFYKMWIISYSYGSISKLWFIMMVYYKTTKKFEGLFFKQQKSIP